MIKSITKVKRNKSIQKRRPLKSNKNISFPREYSKGRIIINKGIRMLEWDGKEWNAFVKEGVRWFPDVLNDNDYDILHKSLKIKTNTK